MTSRHLEVPHVLPHPSAPVSLEETGLSADLLLQLTLKHMHFAGELTGSEKQQVKGLKNQVEGKVQKGVGDVKEAMDEANEKSKP